jgi:hypothetical protein
MKLKGEFVLREIMDETIAIPVGNAALNFNGMICLNDVGKIIFAGLQANRAEEAILSEILETFDVSREEALRDLESFLSRLAESGLLEI